MSLLNSSNFELLQHRLQGDKVEGLIIDDKNLGAAAVDEGLEGMPVNFEVAGEVSMRRNVLDRAFQIGRVVAST